LLLKGYSSCYPISEFLAHSGTVFHPCFVNNLKSGAMKQILTAALLTICISGHAALRPVTVDPVKGVAAAKTEMKLNELPDGVKKTLEGAGFTGWKPEAAYAVRQNNTTVYLVSFVRGDEHESLKLNEEGGKIE
jgi:hypothetical protein